MPDWRGRLRRAFEAHGAVPEADVLDELAAQASAEQERLVADGMPPADAEREVTLLLDVWIRESRELARPRRRTPAVSPPAAATAGLTGLALDVRHGIRLLVRAPAFALLAIVTLALGIGATTMLFSVADGVLMKPLPWPGAERLVRITETRHGRTGRVAGTISNGTFLAWHDRMSTVTELGGWLTQQATLTGAGDSIRVAVSPVTASLFRVLDARPLLGRLFRDDEGGRGDAGVAILSYGLWQERFGGSPGVLGRALTLDGTAYTIVGVMPDTFTFPGGDARLWTAWQVPPVQAGNGALAGVIFRAIARLADGASPEQASAEATSRARQAPDMDLVAQALFGAIDPIDVSAVSELEAVTAEVRPAVIVMLLAAGLLLLTATANVASLQLARATIRRREVALRAALGAGQGRLLRQLIVESATVGLAGGVAGLALAAGIDRVLPLLVPAGFPRLDEVAVDGRVVWFALALSLVASICCGALPAWHTRRLNLTETLAEGGLAPVGGGLRSRLARSRAVIMAGQVAVACALLVGAVLLGRSLLSLVHADRGYDPVNVLTARLPLPLRYPPARRRQVLDELMARADGVPGITAAAYGMALPFVSAGGFIAFRMPMPGRPDVDVDVQAIQRVVSRDYFAAMRLRLVAGRLLSASDTATSPPVVVVNETFARQYLGPDPVGARIPHRGPKGGSLAFANDTMDWEVVGVVHDMRQDAVDAQPQPEIFALFGQQRIDVMRGFDPILVVRTVADPAAYVATLRGLVHDVAPDLALDSVMTLEDRVMASVAWPRLYAIVLACFGTCAMLIAGVGLFGVLSFSVAQRTREMGVRAALGAGTRNLVGLVLGQAAWIVAGGLILGVGAALVGVRLIASFLYGVGTYDTATFIAVPLIVMAVAAVACVVPALRAARTDPLTSLRHV